MSILKFGKSRLNSVTPIKQNIQKPYEDAMFVKVLPLAKREEQNKILMEENLGFLTLLMEVTLPKKDRFVEQNSRELYEKYTSNPTSRTAERVKTLVALYNTEIPYEKRLVILSIIKFIRERLSLITDAPKVLGVNLDVNMIVREALSNEYYVFGEDNPTRQIWQSFYEKIEKIQKQLADVDKQLEM